MKKKQFNFDLTDMNLLNKEESMLLNGGLSTEETVNNCAKKGDTIYSVCAWGLGDATFKLCQTIEATCKSNFLITVSCIETNCPNGFSSRCIKNN